MFIPFSNRAGRIDYEAMLEVLWMVVPRFALAGFVLWLIISQSI